MAFVREFMFEEHQEYGGEGLRATFMSNADPTDGRGVAHDILEHMVDSEGGAEGELMALGAMLWSRGQSGDIQTPYYSTGKALASDIAFILERVMDEIETMRDPGVTRSLGSDYDFVEDWFREGVVKGYRIITEERELSGSDIIRKNRVEYQRRMIGWMRKGFRKANAIYSTRHGRDPYEIAHFFKTIQKKVSDEIPRMFIGMKVKVSIDLQNMTCKVRKYVEEDWNVWVEY